MLIQLHSCRGSLSGVETRSNLYKSVPDRFEYELRRHYFTHRIVSVWNSLPDSVVSAESVNSFKSDWINFGPCMALYIIIEPVHLLPEVFSVMVIS